MGRLKTTEADLQRRGHLRTRAITIGALTSALNHGCRGPGCVRELHVSNDGPCLGSGKRLTKSSSAWAPAPQSKALLPTEARSQEAGVA